MSQMARVTLLEMVSQLQITRRALLLSPLMTLLQAAADSTELYEVQLISVILREVLDDQAGDDMDVDSGDGIVTPQKAAHAGAQDVINLFKKNVASFEEKLNKLLDVEQQRMDLVRAGEQEARGGDAAFADFLNDMHDESDGGEDAAANAADKTSLSLEQVQSCLEVLTELAKLASVIQPNEAIIIILKFMNNVRTMDGRCESLKSLETLRRLFEFSARQCHAMLQMQRLEVVREREILATII